MPMKQKLAEPGRNQAQAPREWMMIGGAKEDRTPDLCIANAALSQLSYRPNQAIIVACSFLTTSPLLIMRDCRKRPGDGTC